MIGIYLSNTIVLLLTLLLFLHLGNVQLQEIETNKTLINSNDTAKTARRQILQTNQTEILQKPFLYDICSYIKRQFQNLIFQPKVYSVLQSIGICLVNGAMELISYFLPSPVIPLVASIAGMMIPFEPVVMLRRQNPVTTYRRAFGTAIRSFLNTFNQYREIDEDPYLEKKFYRRFMGGEDGKVKS